MARVAKGRQHASNIDMHAQYYYVMGGPAVMVWYRYTDHGELPTVIIAFQSVTYIDTYTA